MLFESVLFYLFLPDPGVPGVRSMGPGVCLYVRQIFETLLMLLWLMILPTQYD